MEENNRASKDLKNILGHWFVPGRNESDRNGDGKNLISENELDGNPITRVKINNEDGNVDDYLAGLISELFYVQAGARIFRDYELNENSCNLDERLKELDAVDRIHDDVIFLKRLFYKVIYSLKEVSENKDRQLELVIKKGLDIDISLMARLGQYYYAELYFIKLRKSYFDIIDWDTIDLQELLSEKLPLRYILGHDHSIRRMDFISWLLYIRHFTYVVYTLAHINSNKVNKTEAINTNDTGYSNGKKTELGKLRTDINKLINIWSVLFLDVLNIDYNSISHNEVFSDEIEVKNINGVDFNLGKIQFSCIVAYSDSRTLKSYSFKRSTYYIRILKLVLNQNHEYFKENYFGKKAEKCYGQMWIDNDATQYFSLSGSMKADKNRNCYYDLAVRLLNGNDYIKEQRNVSYVAVPSNESMRFYYGYGFEDYSEYSKVIKMKEVIEAQRENSDFLSRSFSCCERKLLQIVDDPGKVKDNYVAHIFVKYTPCKICSRALRAHKTQRSKIEVSSLKKYNDKRIRTVKSLEDILIRSKTLKQSDGNKDK